MHLAELHLLHPQYTTVSERKLSERIGKESTELAEVKWAEWNNSDPV